MIDRGLLRKLHEQKIIDKKEIMWWQLGFEGRRIFSEAEFLEGSREVSYPVKYTSRRVVRDVPKKETYSVWTRDDVPILLRNVDIGGESVPCFLTVKPMSHYDSGGTGGELWNMIGRAERNFR
jgi:hypothetical protein